MFRITSFGRARGARSERQPRPHSPASSSVESQDSGTSLGVQRGDISNAEYTKRAQALLALHRDLMNLGVGAVFDIPKIVVIGSQSAGKSSLIEAVTGINVPRDSGTCTRCPMSCIMKSTDHSWNCTISLRSVHGTNGVGLDNSHSDCQRFGPVITTKSDVELWLRRAQAAILSRDSNKLKWASKSEAEIRAVFLEPSEEMRNFTKDVIQIEIEDRNLTNLSFVDLPGLIQNAETESIDIVKDLVLDYIQGENTLVLVTIPANDDIQNQGAMKLAKEVDQEGERTIGVITKPDTLGDGDTGKQQAWKRVLQNDDSSDRNYLTHGYYCVRLPNDRQRQGGQSAHTLDPNFFNTTRPWNQVADRRRFGVANLVNDISALLIQLIEKNLPRIRSAVEEALKQCIDRLSKIPPPPAGEPLTNILLMVNAFSRDLDQAVAGDKYKQLAQDSRSRYGRLEQEIRAKSPDFRPYSAGTALSSHVFNLANISSRIRESTGWELPGFTPYDAIRSLIVDLLREWKGPADECFDDVFDIFSSFIEWLAEQHFGSHHNLKAFVMDHARTQLEECKSNARAYIDTVLTMECSPKHFTQRKTAQGEDYFGRTKQAWVMSYQAPLRPNVSIYEEEIEVMAFVKTYWDIAYERFIDMVPLMEEHQLIHALRPKLESSLFAQLTSPQSSQALLNALFAEDPHVTQERRTLVDRRRRLQELKQRLDALNLSTPST